MTDVAMTGLIVMPHWIADFLDIKKMRSATVQVPHYSMTIESCAIYKLIGILASKRR